jgi:type I restriction enzyme, S subunit
MSGALPKTWVAATIDEVLVPNENGKPFQQGWSPQCEKAPAEPDEWGVLKTTAIQEGEFLEVENKSLPDALRPKPHLEVNEGDILMTCAGPRSRCGVTCLVKRTRPRLMISGKMYRFRPDSERILPEYLESYLLSRDAKQAIDRMKTGISDSGLNLTHSRFAELFVPVAPLNEQRRIVGKIEELPVVLPSKTGHVI